MTDTNRFVNTAADGTGDGTTNATTGTSGAYASASAWESAEQGTIATGDRHIVDCCGTAADTTILVIDGWTIADNDALIVRGNRGDAAGFYDGAFEYSASHYRMESADTDSLRAVQGNVMLDGIQAAQSTTNFRSAIEFAPTAGNVAFTVVNCRIKGSASSGEGAVLVRVNRNNLLVRVRNNIIVGATGASALHFLWSANFTNCDLRVANNTVFGCNNGILLAEDANNTGTVTIHNNAVANNTTDFSHTGSGGVTVTNTHNASDDLFGTSTQDLSVGGTESTEWALHWTDPNASAGAKDFNVVASGALDGTGTTGTGIPTTDILGATRHVSAPSIGAFEVAAGGGGEVTATLSLSSAIQAQRTLAASLSAAIQHGRTLTGNLDGAVAAAMSAITSANGAIAAAQSGTMTIDAAISAARTAQASINAAILAAVSASTGLSASITEPGANLATVSLNAAIQQMRSASAQLSAAVQGSGSVTSALSAGIAAVRSISASIDAVIAQVVNATASVDGAVLAALSASASLDARISAVGGFLPALSRTHTAAGQSRTHVVPARTRSH
jgi:hypothetical protein